MTPPVEDIRESLAAIQHDQWSGWMKYMFGKCTKNLDGTYTIPEWAVFRWYDQMMTPYHKLTDKEQDSDRIEADKILALFSQELSRLEEEWIKEVQGLGDNLCPDCGNILGYEIDALITKKESSQKE